MTKHTLTTQPRVLTGRAVKKIRAEGLIPANVFGKNIPSKSLQVNSKEFKLLRKEVGESTLLYLVVEGEKEERPCLIREVVVHPVSGAVLHVSFNQVNLKEKVTAPVSLEIEGESQAVQDKLGILVTQLNEIEIEALPTDMPESIPVDVSLLKAVGDSIKVGDLKLNSKLSIQSDPEAIIVKVEPLAAEEKIETPTTETTEVAPSTETPDTAPETKPEANEKP